MARGVKNLQERKCIRISMEVFACMDFGKEKKSRLLRRVRYELAAAELADKKS